MRTTRVTPASFPITGLEPERLLGWHLPDRLPTHLEEWADLAERLARSRIDWRLIEPHASVSKRGYTRVQLFCGDHWELLLLGWLPGQHSSIHNHGGSAGVSQVLLGELRETLFVSDPTHTIVPHGERSLSDQQTTIESERTIHALQNVGTSPALSLHLYSPPLRTMVEYDDAEIAPPQSAPF